MAKKQKKEQNPQISFTREISAVLLTALAIFLALSLVSHNPWDPGISTSSSSSAAIHNWCGLVGAILSDLLLVGIGLAAYLIPLAILGLALLIFLEKKGSLNLARSASILLFLLASATVISLSDQLQSEIKDSGGLIGNISAYYLSLFLGKTGAFVLLLTTLLISLVISTKVRVVSFFAFLLASLFGLAIQLAYLLGKCWNYLAEKTELLLTKINWYERSIEEGYEEIIRDKQQLIKTKKPKTKSKKKKSKEDLKTKEERAAIEEETEALLPTDTAISDGKDNYTMPEVDLLNEATDEETFIDREELLNNAQLLENKLKDFGVFGKVIEINPGPIITMYEFEPAPGIKVNKIVALADDLALALKAISIRIVAPIPGKAAVGVEIPNKKRQTVLLREVLATNEFERINSPLPLCLGKDIAGNPVVADLKKMPHLLVAGATGSGKSVGLNAMIASLLYRSTPNEVKMLMIDPKMLELSLYEGIPHLLLPVVTSPRKASIALRWSVQEMERRYRLLADLGVRNIDSYNKKIRAKKDDSAQAFKTASQVQKELNSEEEKEQHSGPLPHIVIIIDEFADLMMVAAKDVEDSLTRLAQMARAAGLHIILATQRPSVDIITGIIKANFSTRLSYKVFSRIDSRTILDTSGAEKLLGLGDMLFLPPGTGKIDRIHGCYISEGEVKKIVNFLKTQGSPNYDEEILNINEDSEEAEGFEEEYDELYDQALAIVSEQKVASISMVQRRLRIGYNRAARMIERMEREGVVGAADGGKPRQVLIRRHSDQGLVE